MGLSIIFKVSGPLKIAENAVKKSAKILIKRRQTKIIHELTSRETPGKFYTMIRDQFFGRNLVVLLILAGDTPFDMFFAKICMRL